MIVSVLNFIFCPLCGIPALIFAIIGQDAEKRREIEAAKSHAYHAKIFNIVGLIFFIIHSALTSLSCVGFILFVANVYDGYEAANRISQNYYGN